MKDILVIGSLNMDFVLNLESIPKPGETLSTDKFELIPGGKGANQAYTLGKLGASVALIGCVGRDEYADRILNNLKSVNVDVSGVVRLDNVNTGTAFVSVDSSGENSIIVARGANGMLSKDIIDNNIHLLKNAKMIIMQLEIPIEVVTYVAKLAKKLGKTVILDPAPAKKDLPAELLECIDIIKPNETELQTITGVSSKSSIDIISTASELLNRGINNVIVTLGANGSLLINKENITKFSALDVDVVDTTAAGDSFTAGLAKSLIEGKSLNEAIKYGHIVSSIVVTRKGAQSSIPTEEEVSKFIESGELNA